MLSAKSSLQWETTGGTLPTDWGDLEGPGNKNHTNLKNGTVRLVVENLPANAGDRETQVRSLGQEDPLEKGMATHSSIPAGVLAHTHARGSQAKGHCWGELRPEGIAHLKAQRHASYGAYKEAKETQSIRTHTTEGFVIVGGK